MDDFNSYGHLCKMHSFLLYLSWPWLQVQSINQSMLSNSLVLKGSRSQDSFFFLIKTATWQAPSMLRQCHDLSQLTIVLCSNILFPHHSGPSSLNADILPTYPQLPSVEAFRSWGLANTELSQLPDQTRTFLKPPKVFWKRVWPALLKYLKSWETWALTPLC